MIGGILATFFIIGMAPGLATTNTPRANAFKCAVDFSTPLLNEQGEWTNVALPESNGVTTSDGCPLLPVYSKTFEFPLGTTILSVDVQPSMIQSMTVHQPIRPVPTKQRIGDQIVPVDGIIDSAVYESTEAYPLSWYTVTTGAGLNAQNAHMLFVTVHLAPARYSPGLNLLQYCTHFTIKIVTEPAPPAKLPSDSYPLVIITPSDYVSLLQPLVTHKVSHGLPTKLVTLDEIHSSFVGRDEPERIKYFIKNAVEEYNTQYVLLIGDIHTLPIRSTYASWWQENLLTDQYYADIYDAQGHFCNWDGNGNNRFGEINDKGDDIDGVDLYADVHVGRLSCMNPTEVSTVVNKIITYETETYDSTWFKRIVLAGGDTFPLCRGAPPFVYEGEITNTKVGQALPSFSQTYLWTSKHNLHPWTFNHAISKGAGFVSYAGHGFEHGWATYRPNAVFNQPIWYFTPYVNGISNGNKLPIMFFDACLTAKLDFNYTDLLEYFQWKVHLLTWFFHLSENPSDLYPCFAWYFLQKTDGGAIATIGATRTAYTWVDSNGVYGGAGYLDVHFFMGYHDGTHLGPMLTAGQNDYINNVEKDYFTIEEFLLLGDPSLMVGGYQ